MPLVEVTVPDAPGLNQNASLPKRRSSWPEAAVGAYMQLLGELNAWCWECNQPSASNAWIAETAVRQSW